MSNQDPKHGENKRTTAGDAEGTPPIDLYTKIVEAMKTEGLLYAPKALIPASVTGITSALVLFLGIALAAFFIGKSSVQPAMAEKPGNKPKFVLLVKADDVPPAEGMQQFKEYTAWVENLKKERWAGGEALHGKAWRLHKNNGQVQVLDHVLKASADELSGYFLYEAADADEALKIARTCPHLNYAGTVELREIFQ